MKFRARKRIKPSLNITPLIDVVLLLLIFFMISTTFVVQPGINVNLPETVTSEKQTRNDVVVVITKDNLLYLNDERISKRDILKRFKAEYNKNRNMVLIIKADKAVSHGMVVEIMDLANQAGIPRLAIATIPKELFE